MKSTLPFLTAVLICGNVSAGADFAAPKPNVVFIMADDLGIGDVGCYGKELCKIDTPHIDALAAQGMRFTDAHSIASVCVPVRVAIMTGPSSSSDANRRPPSYAPRPSSSCSISKATSARIKTSRPSIPRSSSSFSTCSTLRSPPVAARRVRSSPMTCQT